MIPLLLASLTAAGLSIHPPRPNPAVLKVQQATIPGTDVPLPPDYDDYSRGRKPLRLFPAEAPGSRSEVVYTGEGTPTFDPSDPVKSAEQFIPANGGDIVLGRCCPAWPTGHSFYNVWTPELVPFVVDFNHPRRTDAAVVVAPGGGRTSLMWEIEGISQAEWLNSLGISAFVLKYRVPSSLNLARKDAQRAMRLLRSKAATYSLNPNRIGFMGFSAGAGIAESLVATNISAYKPIDSIDELGFKPNFLILAYPETIPISPAAAKAFPPTFLVTAADDPCTPALMTRPFSAMLKLLMDKPFISKEYPGGRHGWGNCKYYPDALRGVATCHWQDLAADFMDKYVLTRQATLNAAGVPLKG